MLKKVFGGEIMHSSGGGADRREIERVCRCHVYLSMNDGEALKEERRSGVGDAATAEATTRVRRRCRSDQYRRLDLIKKDARTLATGMCDHEKTCDRNGTIC